jgi:hypothetical protein
VSALRARGRGRNPFLRIVGLDTAGWGLRRLEMRRGHGDGRDGRVVLGIEGTTQGGGERVKSKSEASGVARGSHGGGSIGGQQGPRTIKVTGTRSRADLLDGGGARMRIAVVVVVMVTVVTGGGQRSEREPACGLGWLGSGPTNQTQTRQLGGAAGRTDVSGAGVCQFSHGCACVCVIASRIESSSPGWAKPLARRQRRTTPVRLQAYLGRYGTYTDGCSNQWLGWGGGQAVISAAACSWGRPVHPKKEAHYAQASLAASPPAGPPP